jgi:hypothetical protein
MQSEVMATSTRTARTGRIGTAMLERLAELDPSGFSPDAARIFLQLGFSRAEQRRVDQLSEKARQGSLTPAGGQELDEFIHVANLLAIVQSKARRASKRAGLST